MDFINKCKNVNVIFIFKSVYQFQETQATKALGRLDRRLKVPSEALNVDRLYFCHFSVDVELTDDFFDIS